MNPRPRPVLWDIYEEHLDEAAFLFTQWEDAMQAANYTIAEVAAGPEERLFAHLDALVIGGKPVADKLLFPALEGDDLGKVFAAAWALLHAEDADHFARLGTALLEGKPEAQGAVARAFELGVRTDLANKTAPLWDRADARSQGAVLDVANTRDGAFTRSRVYHALENDDPRLLAAGLRAARRHVDVGYGAYADRALAHESPEVREEAFATAFLYGTPNLWNACRKEASTGTKGSRLPLALLAIRGIGPSDPLFQSLLGDEKKRRHAVWALGFCGTVEAMDVLQGFLDDEKTNRVAGESMTAITGVVIGGQFSRPGVTVGPNVEEEVGPDDPPPEVHSEDFLLIPEPLALRAWWKKVRGQLTPNAAYLQGMPRHPESLRRAVAQGPTWRRAVYVLESAAQERSGVRVDVRGWARAASLP